MNAEISPNGRWLAYESNDTGQKETYVRRFPDVDAGKTPISNGGGTRPLWSRNGAELFYLVGNSPSPVSVMSVPVQSGDTFTAGIPKKVIEGPFFAHSNVVGRTYDASPDGRRFLMIKEPLRASDEIAPPSLVVVLNWFDELKRIAPPKK